LPLETTHQPTVIYLPVSPPCPNRYPSFSFTSFSARKTGIRFFPRKSVPACTPIWPPWLAIWIANATALGGVADHVHLAIRLSRTITTANLVEKLKTSSSHWMKKQSTEFSSFAWQRGYGAFSIGPSNLEALRHYIDHQEEHHQARNFQEEYRAFLTKYGVEHDERYVWD
jgi:hypothetical protein